MKKEESVLPPSSVDDAQKVATETVEPSADVTTPALLTTEEYTVLSPLNVNHTEYAVGEPIDLDEQAAAPLLAVKAIKLANPAPAKKATE